MAWYDAIGGGLKAVGSWATDDKDGWFDNKGMSGAFFGKDGGFGGSGSSLGNVGSWLSNKDGKGMSEGMGKLLGTGIGAAANIYGARKNDSLQRDLMSRSDAADKYAMGKTAKQEENFKTALDNSKRRAQKRKLEGTNTDWAFDGSGER